MFSHVVTGHRARMSDAMSLRQNLEEFEVGELTGEKKVLDEMSL